MFATKMTKLLKCLAVPKGYLLALISDLQIVNLCLKSITECTFCSLQLEH